MNPSSSGHALAKENAGSGGVKVNGMRPLKPHPTSICTVGPSPDDPLELVGRQSVIEFTLGLTTSPKKPKAKGATIDMDSLTNALVR